MISKWWSTAERWRLMDHERDGNDPATFVPREYDAMLDEAAQIYARWRQGPEAEMLPHFEGPFQVSYCNALLFMPDVLNMVSVMETKGTTA